MNTHAQGASEPITLSQYEILYYEIDKLIEDFLLIPEPTFKDKWELKAALLALHPTHKIF